MRTATPTDVFHNPRRYGDMASWRREVLDLHAAGPVHRIEAEGFTPFWAVIGHDAVMSVERQPALFTNAPVPVLANDVALEMQQGAAGADPHAHPHGSTGSHRIPLVDQRLVQAGRDGGDGRLGSTNSASGRWPRSRPRPTEGVGVVDFNRDVAVQYPLQVILSILGLPEDDYARMLTLTQELFGAEDPDLQREGSTPEDRVETLVDMYSYFMQLSADRQANPTDDLATLIANGEIGGEPMPDLEKMGYYVIIATAGHDTTSAAMTEGMAQLASNPDQLALLRDDPSLIGNAVEEMIRLASSVRHFMRTATEDTEIAGQPIKKGDWLMLNYAAANLDPHHFEDPLRFDVTRANANKQIAFGFGIHFCLGAQLARMELRSLFSHLVPRLASAEIAGAATTGQATFVSGFKSLPLRYTLQ